MDGPKTAKQFNAPLTGELTIMAQPGNFTMASGYAHQLAMDAELARYRKLFDALANLVQDPELPLAIVMRIIEVD
jgi:hypothetical protein